MPQQPLTPSAIAATELVAQRITGSRTGMTGSCSWLGPWGGCEWGTACPHCISTPCRTAWFAGGGRRQRRPAGPLSKGRAAESAAAP
eukprot:364089-Chlamydomonas_euryale.AAC.4